MNNILELVISEHFIQSLGTNAVWQIDCHRIIANSRKHLTHVPELCIVMKSLNWWFLCLLRFVCYDLRSLSHGFVSCVSFATPTRRKTRYTITCIRHNRRCILSCRVRVIRSRSVQTRTTFHASWHATLTNAWMLLCVCVCICFPLSSRVADVGCRCRRDEKRRSTEVDDRMSVLKRLGVH